MDQILTIEEIRDRYHGEWVLLTDPETDEHLRVVGGTVIWHSTDRSEVYRKAADLHLAHTAFVYAGEIPVDAVYVL